MPRDGSHIYHLPPGTQGIPDTTIESTKYNSFTADVEQDLNAPRPIESGGTGASSVDGAIFNLGAEKAAQLVTNWDTMVFQPGSFYAASTAGGIAPVAGHAFAGVCYISEALANPPTNQNIVLEARDLTDANHMIYNRVMTAGVWSAWALDISNTVRYDIAQTLTPAQQTQARQNIFAAPFDALAYNGMQINGSFDVSQELGVGNYRNTVGYLCDGWGLSFSGTMSVAAGAAPSGGVPGGSNVLNAVTQTAQPSLGASDGANVYHAIEGYRIARLSWGTVNAQPLTIGFWTEHARPGLYSVAIQNAAANRTYVATYTHNAASVFQYNTVTIPGDTAGVCNVNNTAGLYLVFTFAAGASRVTAPNVWAASNVTAATGQINAVAATTDRFVLNGVIVVPGIEAPSAARSPLIMRPYDQELLTCRRYFWQTPSPYHLFPGYVLTAGAAGGVLTFPVPMRAIPTITFPSANGSYEVVFGTTATGSNNPPNVMTFAIPAGTTSASIQFNTPAVLTAGQGVILGMAGGVINVDARL